MKRFTACLVLLALLFAASCSPGTQTSVTPNEKHTIPVAEGIDPTASGASSYNNSGDHFESTYFAHPDYYSMTSNDHLTVITNFLTYQQTTEWSCGPASVLMAITHFGNAEWDELKIAEVMGTTRHGASPIDVVRFFEYIGWNWEASPTGRGEPDARTFDEPEDFTAWVIENLKANRPILIDWVDWGGHWQAIIGYDTLGTESFGDDVLILADPYDTSDHYQDGYMAISAERFFYMWRSGDGKDMQPFVVAWPNN